MYPKKINPSMLSIVCHTLRNAVLPGTRANAAGMISIKCVCDKETEGKSGRTFLQCSSLGVVLCSARFSSHYRAGQDFSK